MAALPLGFDILIHQKTGDSSTPFYPWTKIQNVYNTDGTSLTDVLAGKASTNHGNHVPTVESANSLRFLRNDNTWAEIQHATTAVFGITKLTDSATTDDSTLAGSAKAVKAAYDKANHTHPYINTNQKGVANGVASLDANGFVPAAQLPSYVDDIIDCKSITDAKAVDTADKDVVPESGKIYIVVTEAAENYGNIYRWSGTKFVSIPQGIALGETSTTAFRGDYGKIAYTHSQAAHARTDATAVAKSAQNGYIKINGVETIVYTHPSGATATNPHGTTKTDVGLGNVENKTGTQILAGMTKANVTTALGYTPADQSVLATASKNGMMSAQYAQKLDGCMEIVISDTEPSKDCMWFKKM